MLVGTLLHCEGVRIHFVRELYIQLVAKMVDYTDLNSIELWVHVVFCCRFDTKSENNSTENCIEFSVGEVHPCAVASPCSIGKVLRGISL